MRNRHLSRYSNFTLLTVLAVFYCILYLTPHGNVFYEPNTVSKSSSFERLAQLLEDVFDTDIKEPNKYCTFTIRSFMFALIMMVMGLMKITRVHNVIMTFSSTAILFIQTVFQLIIYWELRYPLPPTPIAYVMILYRFLFTGLPLWHHFIFILIDVCVIHYWSTHFLLIGPNLVITQIFFILFTICGFLILIRHYMLSMEVLFTEICPYTMIQKMPHISFLEYTAVSTLRTYIKLPNTHSSTYVRPLYDKSRASYYQSLTPSNIFLLSVSAPKQLSNERLARYPLQTCSVGSPYMYSARRRVRFQSDKSVNGYSDGVSESHKNNPNKLNEKPRSSSYMCLKSHNSEAAHDPTKMFIRAPIHLAEKPENYSNSAEKSKFSSSDESAQSANKYNENSSQKMFATNDSSPSKSNRSSGTSSIFSGVTPGSREATYSRNVNYSIPINDTDIRKDDSALMDLAIIVCVLQQYRKANVENAQKKFEMLRKTSVLGTNLSNTEWHYIRHLISSRFGSNVSYFEFCFGKYLPFWQRNVYDQYYENIGDFEYIGSFSYKNFPHEAVDKTFLRVKLTDRYDIPSDIIDKNQLMDLYLNTILIPQSELRNKISFVEYKSTDNLFDNYYTLPRTSSHRKCDRRSQTAYNKGSYMSESKTGGSSNKSNKKYQSSTGTAISSSSFSLFFNNRQSTLPPSDRASLSKIYSITTFLFGRTKKRIRKLEAILGRNIIKKLENSRRPIWKFLTKVKIARLSRFFTSYLYVSNLTVWNKPSPVTPEKHLVKIPVIYMLKICRTFASDLHEEWYIDWLHSTNSMSLYFRACVQVFICVSNMVILAILKVWILTNVVERKVGISSHNSSRMLISFITWGSFYFFAELALLIPQFVLVAPQYSYAVNQLTLGSAIIKYTFCTAYLYQCSKSMTADAIVYGPLLFNLSAVPLGVQFSPFVLRGVFVSYIIIANLSLFSRLLEHVSLLYGVWVRMNICFFMIGFIIYYFFLNSQDFGRRDIFSIAVLPYIKQLHEVINLPFHKKLESATPQSVSSTNARPRASYSPMSNERKNLDRIDSLSEVAEDKTNKQEPFKSCVLKPDLSNEIRGTSFPTMTYPNTRSINSIPRTTTVTSSSYSTLNMTAKESWNLASEASSEKVSNTEDSILKPESHQNSQSNLSFDDSDDSTFSLSRSNTNKSATHQSAEPVQRSFRSNSSLWSWQQTEHSYFKKTTSSFSLSSQSILIKSIRKSTHKEKKISKPYSPPNKYKVSTQAETSKEQLGLNFNSTRRKHRRMSIFFRDTQLLPKKAISINKAKTFFGKKLIRASIETSPSLKNRKLFAAAKIKSTRVFDFNQNRRNTLDLIDSKVKQSDIDDIDDNIFPISDPKMHMHYWNRTYMERSDASKPQEQCFNPNETACESSFDSDAPDERFLVKDRLAQIFNKFECRANISNSQLLSTGDPIKQEYPEKILQQIKSSRIHKETFVSNVILSNRTNNNP